MFGASQLGIAWLTTEPHSRGREAALPAGLVDELFELRGWRAEPGGRSERECVGHARSSTEAWAIDVAASACRRHSGFWAIALSGASSATRRSRTPAAKRCRWTDRTMAVAGG